METLGRATTTTKDKTPAIKNRPLPGRGANRHLERLQQRTQRVGRRRRRRPPGLPFARLGRERG